MTWKQSQYNPIYPRLIELALDVVNDDVALKTDKGWFEEAELYLHWDGSHFETTITLYTDPVYYPGTLYEPPETVCRETTETECFRKIRQVDEWAKSHGFEIDSARRVS